MNRFEREVDPDERLSEGERRRRADQAENRVLHQARKSIGESEDTRSTGRQSGRSGGNRAGARYLTSHSTLVESGINGHQSRDDAKLFVSQ